MAFVPEKNGTILDVACGKGATTRYLLKYYTPENVTGIMRENFWAKRCVFSSRVVAWCCRYFGQSAARNPPGGESGS